MKDKKSYPPFATFGELASLDRVHDLRDSAEMIPGHVRAEELIERPPWMCEPWRSGGGIRGRRHPPLAAFPTRAYCEAQWRAWMEQVDQLADLAQPGEARKIRAQIEAYLWMSAAVANERKGR